MYARKYARYVDATELMFRPKVGKGISLAITCHMPIALVRRYGGTTVQWYGKILTTYLNCFEVKFIYSVKATKVCEIFTLLLSYVVPIKSKVKIPKILRPSQNI